ncbi:MAG: ATPase [Methanobacterium sp.]|jgi:hypothetical protein
MNKGVLECLDNIGVDNRFISLWNNFLFINNLKFSRFSRRKEELFKAKFPKWTVVRSKILQKMCIRASRVLSKSLNPQETILIEKIGNCVDLALYVILESYTRKYGIKIIYGENELINYKFDSIASPLTLDLEVENIINKMIQGKKIKAMNSHTEFNQYKTIYPLINVPNSWIESWIHKNNLSCLIPPCDGISYDLINFFEEFIPNVRENMLKSAIFVTEFK